MTLRTQNRRENISNTGHQSSSLTLIKRGESSTVLRELAYPSNEQNHIYTELYSLEDLNHQASLKEQFETFKPERRAFYPHFYQATITEQETMIGAMLNHQYQEYWKLLYSSEHKMDSSLETKSFCLNWFLHETDIKTREEAIEFFAERISVEAALTIIFESFTPALQKKFHVFFESRFDQKQQILSQILQEKNETEKATKKIEKEYKDKIHKALGDKLINQWEYSTLKGKFEKLGSLEEKQKALKELESSLEARAKLIVEFSGLKEKVDEKDYQKFFEGNFEERKAEVKRISQLPIEKKMKKMPKKKPEQPFPEDKIKKSKIYLNLANSLENQRQFEKALGIAKQALLLDPNSKEIQRKIHHLTLCLQEEEQQKTHRETKAKILSIIAYLSLYDEEIKKEKANKHNPQSQSEVIVASNAPSDSSELINDKIKSSTPSNVSEKLQPNLNSLNTKTKPVGAKNSASPSSSQSSSEQAHNSETSEKRKHIRKIPALPNASQNTSREANKPRISPPEQRKDFIALFQEKFWNQLGLKPNQLSKEHQKLVEEEITAKAN